MQTLKEWLIYYVHDETFLGKALNAFVERIRLTLQTILNSSDGSLAGDAFAVCCLLLVHLFFPMILIWLYYGFRLRQIKRGKITDPQYHIKAKKYFGQASVVLMLNVILALSYIELSDITGLFMTSPPPTRSEISEPKAPLPPPRKPEFEHVYITEFKLLFSYLTRHQFPISCQSNSDAKSLYFTAKPEHSVVLSLKPFSPENFDSIPEQTISLEVFADPLKDNEIPQLQQYLDSYHPEKPLKVDEILSLTGFSITDADKLRPVCRFRYQPKVSPQRPDQIQSLSQPKQDSDMEPEYAFEKAEIIVFNIPGGWVAYAVNLKMPDRRQIYDGSDDFNSPGLDTEKPETIKPVSNDSEIIDRVPADRHCITPPPLRPNDYKYEHYPIITKMRFCTPDEFLILQSDTK